MGRRRAAVARADARRRHPAARSRAHPRLGRGRRVVDGHGPPCRRRAVALLRLDAGLRREAPGVEAPPSAARAAAAHVPHPAARHRPRPRRLRRVPLLAGDHPRPPVRGHARALRRGVRAGVGGDLRHRRRRRRPARTPRRLAGAGSARAACVRRRRRPCTCGAECPIARSAMRIRRVPWAETASETFVARHDERDASDAERVLAQLEYAREGLEKRLEVQMGELAVVLHGSPAQLDAAQPWIAAAAAADRAGRAPLRGRLGGRARAARALPPAARPARLQRRGLAGDADARAVGAARPPRDRAAAPRATRRRSGRSGCAAGCATRGSWRAPRSGCRARPATCGPP